MACAMVVAAPPIDGPGLANCTGAMMPGNANG
jgi:hypothetical protein